MRASDFMTTAVLTTTPSESVKAATRQLLERRIAAMPVVDDDGRLVGIVSEVDVLRERVPADPPTHVRTEEPPRTSLPRTVADVMTRDVYALPVGAEHARRRGAVLVPVYVHQPVLGDVPGLGGGFEDLAALEAVERRSLELACQELGAGEGAAPVEAEVVVGHAGSTLTALTRPQDLLVVGSRGRGGFAALLLGSTSTQCVQHATCPVLVVR